MPIVKQSIQNLTLEGEHAKLDNQFLRKHIGKFKKVTATRFANIICFKLNQPHTSEFKVWMEIVGLYKETPAAIFNKVGNTIEPVIRHMASERFNIYWERWDVKKERWDAFKENKIFGGIPDGEPMNRDSEIDYTDGKPLLEIKTTSIDKLKYENDGDELRMCLDENGYPIVMEANKKYLQWFNNGIIDVPLAYRLQLGLYLYLRRIEQGLFAVAFLKPEDYKYPEYFGYEHREIRYIWMFVVSSEFKILIDYVEDWYLKYVKTGISPRLTADDKKWLDAEMKKAVWINE